MINPLSPRFAEHPSGLRLEFHPEPHHYLLNGEKLESVTTRIHRWFPQFDAQAVARRKAEKDGLHAETLVALWEQKRNQAATFGTRVHHMAELILTSGDDNSADHVAETPRELNYLRAIKAALARVRPSYDFIETEKIVFGPDARVAGTIDLLLRNKKTGEWVIGDWKTNREIKYQSYGDESGFGPCDGLANCNFIHYSLQTAAYGELLTNEGYLKDTQSVRGVLFHLKEFGDQVVCDFVKTKSLTSQARKILFENL